MGGGAAAGGWAAGGGAFGAPDGAADAIVTPRVGGAPITAGAVKTVLFDVDAGAASCCTSCSTAASSAWNAANSASKSAMLPGSWLAGGLAQGSRSGLPCHSVMAWGVSLNRCCCKIL